MWDSGSQVILERHENDYYNFNAYSQNRLILGTGKINLEFKFLHLFFSGTSDSQGFSLPTR